MDVSTRTVTLSITEEAWQMLCAFNAARNGSINNQADSAIRTGVATLVSRAPPTFQQNYVRALVGKAPQPPTT